MVCFLSRSIRIGGMVKVSSEQISEAGGSVLQSKQKLPAHFSEVLPASSALPTSLVFVSTRDQFLQALEKKVQGLIILKSLLNTIEKDLPSQLAVWTAESIPQSMTQILKLFDVKQAHLTAGAHPTAVIHPTAKVSKTAHVGAYTVIEAHAVVGDNVILHPHVFIGSHCMIEARTIIAPHTTIGSDGFGFFSDKKNNHHRIPQIGKVVIEEDCEIGAQCAIDRATLTETRIRKGSKLDNFCHIAHNVEIGENSLITAGFIVAGSTTIGRNLTTAGGVHVVGHVQITDNVILTGRAAVTSNVTEPGIYGGFPLEPHRESIKTLASLPKIKSLRKQVQKILKHLNLNDEE